MRNPKPGSIFPGTLKAWFIAYNAHGHCSFFSGASQMMGAGSSIDDHCTMSFVTVGVMMREKYRP